MDQETRDRPAASRATEIQLLRLQLRRIMMMALQRRLVLLLLFHGRLREQVDESPTQSLLHAWMV